MTHDESLFRALLESAPDAMVIVDQEGAIVLVNAQTERMFGYQRGELLGQQVEILVPDRARTLHRGHRHGYFEAAHPRPMGVGLELHGRRKDGREFPVEISLSPLTTEGGTLVASAIRDITDRKRMEDDRLRLLRERAAHEEASRIKDEFIATLSHELRTPLNAILGWATLLEGGRLPPSEIARGLATIRRNAKAQSQLIEDLLDVSRIVTGKLQLRNELVDLASVLESSVEVVRPAAVARRLSLDVVMEVRPLLITGDANRLQQAIWNVLSNAIKFTEGGGRITINLRSTEDTAVLTIRDSGRGIPPEFLPFIFDRFRQVDSSSTRKHGGLGLGLAIAKSIVELHGGTISAHSSGEGMGAAFQMRLPQTQIVSATGTRPLRPVEADVRLDGLHVLVVDDQPDERELMNAVLGSAGASVTTAGSGDEALQLLRVEDIDVVVSDLAMPGRDGYELVRLIVKDFPGLPVMALTAHARPEDQQRALLAGFRHYLSKPVEPDDLARAVASLVPRRVRQRRGLTEPK
jgi:PAS domain S-box-containing protein